MKSLKIFEEMGAALMSMPDDKLGRLLKDMLSYRFYGVDNHSDDLGWQIIKSKIDAAREWDEKRSEIYRNNGKKGGRGKKKEKSVANTTETVTVNGKEIMLRKKGNLNV